MFQQAAYAASATGNHHDLLFHQLAEAHEDRGDLGAGGVRLRAELAVRTLNQALADGPLHRVDGPRTDVGSVRKLRQILRERNRFEAVFHGIAEEHCHKLLARDRAGHIHAVGDFVLHRPALTGLIPRRTGRVLAVEAGENRDDHAARRIGLGGELTLARAVHQALVDCVVDRGGVPGIVRNVAEFHAVLARVLIERVDRRLARRHRRRRLYRCHHVVIARKVGEIHRLARSEIRFRRDLGKVSSVDELRQIFAENLTIEFTAVHSQLDLSNAVWHIFKHQVIVVVVLM